MAEYREQFWSIDLPDGWSGVREDESTLLRRDTTGVGTLSVTLLCDKEPVTSSKVRELASSTLEEGHQPYKFETGEFAGLYFAYEEEGVAWREWYLSAGNCLFFISYDCPEDRSDAEVAEVDTMVATLRHLS